MATRKKSPARSKKVSLREGGLAYGPSRKLYDWEREKAGSVLQETERRESIYNGDVLAAGSAGSIIYTCPPGKRAKLIYATLAVKSAEGHIEVLLKGVSTFVLATYTGGTQSFVAAYQDGIDLEAGDKITLVVDATAGNAATGSVQVIEEEFSSGYVTST